MVRLKKEKGRIYSYCCYVWTYHDKWSYQYTMSMTKKSFYRKKICIVPFYTRVHAKHVVTTLYGVDVLKHVHFITGKKLREMGIKHISTYHNKYLNYINIDGKGILYKGKYRHRLPLKMYIFPPEYQYNKHRRRHFAIALRDKRRKGILYFNKWYKKQFYGYRSSISREALTQKRKEVNNSLVPEISKTFGDI